MFRPRILSLSTVSRAVDVTPLKGHVNPGPIQFARGKRTKKRLATVSTATQRVITQLSVLSQRKKAPRMLKLSNEDLIRHQTVQRAWSLFQKDQRDLRNEQLAKQFDNIQFALEDLQQIDNELYKIANKKEKGKRFPLDKRIPVDYPPNQIWHYDVKKKEN